MNFPESSPYRLGLDPDGQAQKLFEQPGGGAGFLGFDTQSVRLVEIRKPGGSETASYARFQSLKERVNLASGLRHPRIAGVLDAGEDEAGDYFYVTEFVEGERLGDYLARAPKLPPLAGLRLVLQLAEAAVFLSDHPRLASAVCLDDFAVVLERGCFLSLRLTDLGFEREEKPVADGELAVRWIEMAGRLLQAVLEGGSLPAPGADEAAKPLHGPLAAMLENLRRQPGPVAIHELKSLKKTLIRAAGLREMPARPDAGGIPNSDFLPRGPLCRLCCESAELEDTVEDHWRLIHEDFCPDGDTPFALRAKPARRHGRLESRPERIDLRILPPERLLGHCGLGAVNRKMSHAYLREHPNVVRTRSLVCTEDFTLVAAEGVRGFSLMTLAAQRGTFTPREAMLLLLQVDRLHAHFEGVNFEMPALDPWRVLFHFGEASGDRVRVLARQTPVTEWEAPVVKLRVETITDAVVDSAGSAWRYLLDRLNGKPFTALAAWLMEGERFDRLLAEGLADGEPLSDSAELDDLLRKAAHYLDESDPMQRRKFRELLEDCLLRQPSAAFARPMGEKSGLSGAEEIEFEIVSAA
ncbi:MAG: hypothetical protein KDM91_04345 [Verrucomicrobiae bacterium]|nr:hypothetical protein [Verrucomicrobiae bacterium]